MASPSDLETRLRFLDLSPADTERLGEIGPLLEKHANALVAVFYRHLLSFEPTRNLLRNPEVRDRLLVKQREYLLSLAGTPIDEDYVADRVRIGETHESVGLGPRWYLGAYSLYMGLLGPLIAEHFHPDAVKASEVQHSLSKVLMLDVQLAMEAYIQKREEQLEFLNQELAEAGRTLSREYDEQTSELRQTTRRAQAAEQLASVGTLAAGLAHEIGTPMGVIRGHAELLESAVGEERGRWRLRTIVEQIDRIASIMQALLDLARPHEPERVLFSLAQTIERSVSFLSEKFRRRDIEVRCDVAADLPALRGDPDRMHQLFLNLFLNAADAMPEGGKLEVRVRAEGTGEGETWLVVQVRDTGGGIPPEHVDKIFEPFYTTKPAGSGSGIGLMVSRAIVLEHGGEIEVESELERGTEFRIVLPAERG